MLFEEQHTDGKLSAGPQRIFPLSKHNEYSYSRLARE